MNAERSGLTLRAGALLVARREIKDQLRDWRILTPVILLTLFFPVLMNFTAGQAVAFVGRYGADIIAERLIPFLLMIVGFFPISVSLVIALETFAGERERLSLETLLATPLSDSQVYFGKVLASLVVPLSAAYLGIGVYLSGLALRIGWTPPLELLLQVLLLTAAQAAVMICAAVVISSQTTSVRAANLLASFIIVPVSQLIIGESLIMFWGRYSVLWWIVLGLMVVAVLLGRMGLHLFNREELLGREVDMLDLRWAWRTFRAAFLRGARTPQEWLQDTLTDSLRSLGMPILLMIVALIAAYMIGYGLAARFTIPADLIELSRLDGSLLEDQLRAFGLYSTRGVLWIFFNNLRAILLATAFGVLSFGVLGVILLMAPIGILGYLAGNIALSGQSAGRFMAALVAPHALVEIPAAILGGALILHIGLAIVSPPSGRSLGESWLMALADWARLSLVLVLPMLALAAALEIFITPRVAVMLLTGS